MVRLIDADKVIAMLRHEAKEWAAAAEMNDAISNAGGAGFSMAYRAAADDVEKMANEQAEGSVPTDNLDLY